MPPMMQGIIIALLISLLVGILIGFSLRQGRVNALTKSLKESRDRQESQARDHEVRLRTATEQLQRDYEQQLAEKSERYQRQYDEQVQRLETEYQARQNAALDGGMPPGFDPEHPEADLGTVPVSEAEQQIRKQYEARLKDIAYKIQQAYEQHLREKLAEARDAYQAEYDQRLSQALERYQDEAEARLAEALRDRDLQVAALGVDAAVGVGGDGNDTQVQERVAALEVELRAEYDRRLAERIEQYQDDMTQRTAQLEQEFAARLQMAQAAQPAVPPAPPQGVDVPMAELEARLQAQYDQQLAEAIARHQDELMRRTEALEADFAARLHMAQQGGAMGASPGPGLGSNLSSSPSGLDSSSTWHPGLDTPGWDTEGTVPADEGGFSQSENDFEPDPDPLMDTASAAEMLEDGQLDIDPFTDLDDALAFGNDDAASGLERQMVDAPASDAQALQPDGSEGDWATEPLDLATIELPGIERLSPIDANAENGDADAELDLDWDMEDGSEADGELDWAEDLDPSGPPDSSAPWRESDVRVAENTTPSEDDLDFGDLSAEAADDDQAMDALDGIMGAMADEDDFGDENDTDGADPFDDDLRNLG